MTVPPAGRDAEIRDPKDIVRAGYDALSYRYQDDEQERAEYAPWLAALHARLSPASTVLDIGCGCGLPVARTLVGYGHTVTGVDISDVQIERARILVPEGTFVRADAADLAFAPASFDAVVSFYALIHMPYDEQEQLLHQVAVWLRPGGWFVATTGHTAWTGTDDVWLGGTAAMWWSHPDADVYRQWLTDAGLVITGENFIAEGDGGHHLFWARRESSSPERRRGSPDNSS